MSTSYLKIISTNSNFEPTEKAYKKSQKFLERKYSCEIEISLFKNIEFIDQGENLEAIICPNCKTINEIDFFNEDDPVGNWWYKISELIPTKLSQVTMPCCSATVDATTLTFNWIGGFAKFEISLIEPDFAELKNGRLKPRHLKKLQSILGSKLIEIQAQY